MKDSSQEQPPVQASVGAASDEADSPIHAATQWQKVLLVLCHLILAVGMIFWTYVTIERFNEATFAEISTPWKLPDGARFKDGPATFHYDPEQHTLNHRGALDVEEQLRLRALLEFDTEGAEGGLMPVISASEINTTIRSYQAAIGRLAYLAGTQQVDQIQLLLLFGVMGGILGAILRSLVDFVGHACYTGKLDLMHWWPLYVTRPLVGAILGFVLVVLLKARLLTSPDIQQGNESFWWLGVAVLGGFSTVDVTQRLRLAAKAIFGTASEGKRDQS
ncbi:hypothetical protein [Ectopseudomonas alcaliphila]|uniref:hypothetical protein n=1 Tax=Ectopseudomonas alcaliphila TaxID=101564 RepID=UPI0027890FA4|nr:MULTISPECIES: hypothetical protein [Pseudomonas]MDP9941258.1 hypothetical protein [Pseudomonas sp. 3400]MDR7013477.1 hypothetical protein [Pseudomonas alcaliphila]